MIAAAKLLGVISATVAILLAGLFAAASTMSLGSTDPRERRDATVSAFWSMIIIGLCAAAILSLTGCQAAKTAFDTCRDGLCR